MKRRMLACALGAATLALMMSSAAGADQSYTDPNGDGKSGTDIVAVTVRNDTAGKITIQVQSASTVVANHAIAVFIDSDRNPATGQGGDDYWMYGGPLVGASFLAWNGSSYVDANPSSFNAWLVGTNITQFDFNTSAIGNVAAFNFYVASISIDPPNVNLWDYAPDAGYWSYSTAGSTTTTTTTATTTTTVTPPPPPPATVVRPVIGAAVFKPAHPVAGKPLVVTFPVTRSDSGAALTGGKMVCDPSVAGKVIAHAESFKGGTARLAFTVPKTAKGKMLSVHVTISQAGRSAQKTVRVLVR